MTDGTAFAQQGYVVARQLFNAGEAAAVCALPDDAQLVPIPMEPGDVLFFNGSLVHGSKPNTSTRVRRALIGHYIQAEAREVAYWYHPVLRMDGTEVALEESLGGGACGEWVERDGARAIELTGYAVDPRAAE